MVLASEISKRADFKVLKGAGFPQIFRRIRIVSGRCFLFSSIDISKILVNPFENCQPLHPSQNFLKNVNFPHWLGHCDGLSSKV